MQSFLPHQTFDAPAVSLTHSRSLDRCSEVATLPVLHATFIDQFATVKATVGFRCGNDSFETNLTIRANYLRKSPAPPFCLQQACGHGGSTKGTCAEP